MIPVEQRNIRLICNLCSVYDLTICFHNLEDIQNIANVGELKEWVIWKMKRIGKKGGEEKGTETRKEIKKLWTKWENKGLISNDPAAPLPNPASIMCIITHGTGEYNEAKAYWEKRGKH